MGIGAGYDPQPRPAGESLLAWLPPINHPLYPWLLLVIPTVGGLLSGLFVYTLAPEAEGHGTDAVIAAYHLHEGQIRPRVPLVKIVASALTLGTGGSGGREGPIAQIGAGFGSLLANLLRLRAAERRVLMAAGMGAGIAAIFRAPLAGALFAAEVLYRSPEFEAEVIMPAAIACVVSYCTLGAYAGWQPLFATPDLSFHSAWELGPYLLLVLFMVVLAALYTRTFYGCVRVFRRVPVRPHFRPALGAFLTGLVALVLYYLVGQQQQVLAVLSFGYSAVQDAVTNESTVSAWVLLAIALGKILTTGLTIGSGGSGGVFGPSMVIGGCGGGALGLLMHHWWPALVPHPASFVIVGMAGFFAAAAKTPISTLVIVSEMTGGYHLLLPALWVCALAFILSDEQSIYSSQMESRSRSPAHQGSYVREVLAGVRVSQFLKPGQVLSLLYPYDSLDEVVRRLSDSPYSILPVVDGEKRLLGVVNLEEVHLASQAAHMRALRPGGGLDAERYPAAHPRQHPRPGAGTVRRERPADTAGGRWSRPPASDWHGAAVRHLQRLHAAYSRAGAIRRRIAVMSDDNSLEYEPGVLRVLQSKSETRHFYNKIAKVYDLLAEHSERAMREAGLRLLTPAAGERLLEIGFGTGHVLVQLAKAVGPTGRVFGLDISENMLSHARDNLQRENLADRVELHCGDAEDLPFGRDSLDGVFLCFTLELFDTPEIPRVLAQCLRVLRPGGRIVVVAVSKEGKQGAIVRAFEWTHQHFPNLMDCRPIYARRAIEAVGFTVDEQLLESMWVPVEIVRGRKPG